MLFDFAIQKRESEKEHVVALAFLFYKTQKIFIYTILLKK